MCYETTFENTQSKGHKIKEVSTFTSPKDILSKYFCQICFWLADDQHPHVKNLPINEDISTIAVCNQEGYASTNDNISVEPNLELCEDSIIRFMGNEEEFYEDQYNTTVEINK